LASFIAYFIAKSLIFLACSAANLVESLTSIIHALTTFKAKVNILNKALSYKISDSSLSITISESPS